MEYKDVLQNLFRKLYQEEFFDLHELAEITDLEIIETTTGTNGYPQNLRFAITSDSMQDLMDLEYALNFSNLEIKPIYAHKRDGWQLWERTTIPVLEKGQFLKPNDDDWYIQTDANESEEYIKNDIRNNLWGGVWDDVEYWMENNISKSKAEDTIENILEDILYYKGKGEVMVFYNPDENYKVDYIVSEDSTGYAYDTNHYKVGLLINEKK